MNWDGIEFAILLILSVLLNIIQIIKYVNLKKQIIGEIK